MIAFFLCSSLWAATEVASVGDTLTPGVSPLPHGCYWLEPDPSNSITQIVAWSSIGDRIAIAYVTLKNNKQGFSAGYLTLM